MKNLIYKKIIDAKNILLNIHISPDLDSVGSAIAFSLALQKLGKNTTIVSPSKLEKSHYLIKEVEKVKTVDFSSFDFSSFDLFIILDCSSYDRVTGDKKITLPSEIKTIVIDHHKTNEFSNYKNLKELVVLIDENASATAEIVFFLLKDWGIEIDKKIATMLLAGIIGDTVFFKAVSQPKKIFSLVNELLEKGADYQQIVSTCYQQLDFELVKMVGVFLQKLKKDKKHQFVYSVVDYKTYKKHNFPTGAREMATDMFFQSIFGAKLGLAVLEKQPGEVSVSFRSKGEVDVSLMAQKLGGGGHKNAAGVTMKGELKKTVKKILSAVKDYLTNA